MRGSGCPPSVQYKILHLKFDFIKRSELSVAVNNSAVMNIGVHVSLSILVSLVCMPSSGIAAQKFSLPSLGGFAQGSTRDGVREHWKMQGVLWKI